MPTIKAVLLLIFISSAHSAESKQLSKAYFAGGCFWGVEYFFERQDGVKEVISGYMGGWVDNPTYRDVSYTHSGHYEVIEVLYDPQLVDYKSLTSLFFNIHDPTQIGAQGPDVGDQYSSMIFYNSKSEKDISLNLISTLEGKGYAISTELKKSSTFWKAEENHQDYYKKNNGTPYCHAFVQRL